LPSGTAADNDDVDDGATAVDEEEDFFFFRDAAPAIMYDSIKYRSNDKKKINKKERRYICQNTKYTIPLQKEKKKILDE
jgi:hypothetical protein